MKLSENTKEEFLFRIYSVSDSPATRHYTETAIRQCTLLQISSSSSSSSSSSCHHVITTIIIVSDSSTKNHQTPRLHLPRSSFPGVTSGAEVEGRGDSANQTLNLLELDTFHNFTFARDLLTFHLLHL